MQWNMFTIYLTQFCPHPPKSNGFGYLSGYGIEHNFNGFW